MIYLIMYIHIISIHIYTYYIYICICMYNTFISYTLCAVQGRDDDVPRFGRDRDVGWSTPECLEEGQKKWISLWVHFLFREWCGRIMNNPRVSGFNWISGNDVEESQSFWIRIFKIWCVEAGICKKSWEMGIQPSEPGLNQYIMDMVLSDNGVYPSF